MIIDTTKEKVEVSMSESFEELKWEKYYYTDKWDSKNWDNNLVYCSGMKKLTIGYEFQFWVPFLDCRFVVHPIPDSGNWKKQHPEAIGKWTFYLNRTCNRFLGSDFRAFDSSDEAKAATVRILRERLEKFVETLPT